MTTTKQKNALKKMVENGGNASKAMKEAGYSPKTAKTPQKLTNSKGFKDLCDEQGLTEELIISSLVKDIQDKPGGRKGELELAAKIRGLLKNQVDVSVKQSMFGKAHDELKGMGL
ncbi:MAG: hypothetical protein OEL89_05380 [Candidatus Peregrinibacteria bacterium]|nr:hypothetical protein [Candidatus Peregrinibacteria bacterium]